jgi:hypothetical protein
MSNGVGVGWVECEATGSRYAIKSYGASINLGPLLASRTGTAWRTKDISRRSLVLVTD